MQLTTIIDQLAHDLAEQGDGHHRAVRAIARAVEGLAPVVAEILLATETTTVMRQRAFGRAAGLITTLPAPERARLLCALVEGTAKCEPLESDDAGLAAPTEPLIGRPTLVGV